MRIPKKSARLSALAGVAAVATLTASCAALPAPVSSAPAPQPGADGAGTRVTVGAATVNAASTAGTAAEVAPVAFRRAVGDRRPNILMITVDDAAPENMKYMPNVRRLIANRGVTLTNGVSPTSICVPARASLLTGQYAHNHGARTISGPYGGFDVFRDGETVPVWLQRAGYDTMFIGKYLNGYGDGRGGEHYVPPGWTDWRGTVGSSTTNYVRPKINHDGRVRSIEVYNSDLFSRYTVAQLREKRRKQRPWFMMVNYVAPHAGGPFEAGDPENWSLGTPAVASRHRGRFNFLRLPDTPNMWEQNTRDKALASGTRVSIPQSRRDATREDHQQRVESLLAVDEAVAKAIRTLRETNQLGNTVVMFSSDNGYLIGQHNRFAKPRHYEESQKVPMLLAGPGIPKGKRVATQVTNPDLAATVVSLAGARSKFTMDGQSIMPLLRTGTRNRIIPIQAWNHKDGSDELYRGVRTHEWTYVEFPNGEAELYNHQNDPYQLNNVANELRYQSVVTRLSGLTARYTKCRGTSCYNGLG